MSTLTLTEQAAPSTPSAGKAVIYLKADGFFYAKDDAGVEAQVNASSITAEVAAAIAAFLLTLDKNDVGLGNVDNTSDANKPVSTAQGTALDLKAPLADPTFTGTVGGITKAMVGLGNVDNTSDSTKNAAAASLENKTLVVPKISQATTAGAPTYEMGALYFDTTLNKLRVGGATAWETVTSS